MGPSPRKSRNLYNSCDGVYGGTGSEGVEGILQLLLGDEERLFPLEDLLKTNETFNKEQGKETVTKEEIIERLYAAIFVTDYKNGAVDSTVLGRYEFNATSRDYALQVASMLSYHAVY